MSQVNNRQSDSLPPGEVITCGCGASRWIPTVSRDTDGDVVDDCLYGSRLTASEEFRLLHEPCGAGGRP
jgi:hypothetical protein